MRNFQREYGDRRKTRLKEVACNGIGWMIEITCTYDWAFLEPLAFPPDLPPVMMIDFWGV